MFYWEPGSSTSFLRFSFKSYTWWYSLHQYWLFPLYSYIISIRFRISNKYVMGCYSSTGSQFIRFVVVPQKRTGWVGSILLLQNLLFFLTPCFCFVVSNYFIQLIEQNLCWLHHNIILILITWYYCFRKNSSAFLFSVKKCVRSTEKLQTDSTSRGVHGEFIFEPNRPNRYSGCDQK